jgi:hypothetical protein
MFHFLFTDVCNLRLDFESFTLAGTTDTSETAGGTCLDKLDIKVAVLNLFLQYILLYIDILGFVFLQYYHIISL